MLFMTSGENGPRSGMVEQVSSSWEARRSADPKDFDLLMPTWERVPTAREGGRGCRPHWEVREGQKRS